MTRRLRICMLGLVSVLVAQSAAAGTIYLTRAAFLAALGVPTNVSETFEGFALGPVANPLTIMGGEGEIEDTSPSISSIVNTVGGPSPSQAWIANVGNTANVASIRGVGNTALGFSAMGFDFAHELANNRWTFATTLGNDLGPILTAGPPVLDSFIGWIGLPGETLNAALWSGSGLIVDNIVARDLQLIPEPATLLLLGGGLAAARFRRRRL